MNENIAILVFIVILVILCAGDPDLIDALVHRLMTPCN